jgi:signal transduction histidine kinase
MKKKKENLFQKFTHSMTIESLRERVQWLVTLRWIAGVMVVISVLAAKAFLEIENIAVPLALGFFILFYNLVFHLVRKYFVSHPEASDKDIKRRYALINLQIFLDLTVLAALIYFTGGIANPFLSFFIFHMVISSILLSRVNAYLWAFFTIGLETLLFYLEHFGYIPCHRFLPGYPTDLVKNGDHVFFILMAFSVTLLITVYFATSIMRPIRKRQLELTELQNRLEQKRDLLELKNKELSDMDRSKTEFLYRVEHELKAPIGALQSLISVVSRGYSAVDEAKRNELLARAENRVTLMKELVSDLLSLSRVSERSFTLELQPIDLKQMVYEAVDELNTYSKKRGVPIKIDAADALPEIMADKHAMEEITRNLIHNAVKYSFEGDVNVRLTTSEGNLVMEVQDHGIGISEEDLPDVFKEFYRTPNAKAFEEGSGLGLSLVKRLVEHHNGAITVTSQLNKGTTFTVTLPVDSGKIEELK